MLSMAVREDSGGNGDVGEKERGGASAVRKE